MSDAAAERKPKILVISDKTKQTRQAANHVKIENFPTERKKSRKTLFSFIGGVVLPAAACATYLWGFAADRYETGFSFSVRSQTSQTPQASAMTAMMGGGAAASDAGVVSDFISSREMVARLTESGLPLAEMFSRYASSDPVFSLRNPQDPEKLAGYWHKNVISERDPQTGIVRVRLSAFSAQDAETIAQATLEQSKILVEELSEQSRSDLMRASENEVSRSRVERDNAYDALSDFRERNNVIDPAVTLAGRVKIIDDLRAQLDEELLARDTILGNGSGRSSANDVRLQQSELNIRNIESRIAARVSEFGDEAGYARLASEFEDLKAKAEFSELTLRNAITMRDATRKEADTRAAYLTSHVSPHTPATPTAPRRASIFGVVSAFLVGLWLLGRLVLIAVRERS